MEPPILALPLLAGSYGVQVDESLLWNITPEQLARLPGEIDDLTRQIHRLQFLCAAGVVYIDGEDIIGTDEQIREAEKRISGLAYKQMFFQELLKRHAAASEG